MRNKPTEALRPVAMPDDERGTYQDVDRDTASEIADEVQRRTGTGLSEVPREWRKTAAAHRGDE